MFDLLGHLAEGLVDVLFGVVDGFSARADADTLRRVSANAVESPRKR
ncbi:hypothetical protein [Halorussus ruber]